MDPPSPPPRPRFADLSRLIARVVERTDLSMAEAEAAFDRIMEGTGDPLQVAALLAAIQTKGIAATELAGGVRALRRAMIPVPSANPEALVDTAGTGGGGVTTFNISTAAAIVAAAGGVPLAKHGNRSFTSRSGSADVLEALGVPIELAPEALATVLARVGIVFMFAPLLHPAMRFVAPVRRALGVTTIMNVLGPLTNPAGATRQVIGVADPGLLALIPEALRELGHRRALVVHGAPGMDEISPSGPTEIAELRGGNIRFFRIVPEEMGLERHPLEGLAGGGPESNARLIRSVLRGVTWGAARDAVMLNAAAALYVGDRVETLREGVELAGRLIESGEALARLEALGAACRDVLSGSGSSPSREPTDPRGS